MCGSSMKKLLALLLPILLVGCDQSFKVNIESNSDKPHYCSVYVSATESDESFSDSEFNEECKAGDTVLFHYWEEAPVNYDQASDYDYRPVALINKVCDHSKEIVVQKVIDTTNFQTKGLIMPQGYRGWDVSCVYSGQKELRGITELMNKIKNQNK